MNELISGNPSKLIHIPHGAEAGLSAQTAVQTEDEPIFEPAFQTAAVKSGGMVRRTAADVLSRFHVSRAFILVALVLWVGLYLFSRLYFPSYAVVVNGTNLGMVRNRADFEKAVELVEAKATKVLGYNYTLKVHPEYKFTYTLGAQYVPSSVFDSYLTNQVAEMTELYAITVNGTVVGAAKDEAALNEVLKQILNSYRDQNTTSASFVQKVSVQYQYVPVKQERDLSTIKTLLSGNTKEEAAYTTVSGDTLTSIAQNYNMTLSGLLALNPSIGSGTLQEGQTVKVQKTVPLLSVRTTKTVPYTQPIPFEVQTVRNSNMYEGDTKVMTVGKNGSMQVMANQTLINGKVTSQAAVGSKVLTKPVTQVVAVGTAPRPLTAPTGKFIRPTSGHITSPFGYRYIFGSVSFHSGVDIANSYGTNIKAADGGNVIFAGNKGSYGNLIIVDHGSGRETCYAHCSSILVKAGDPVYQGQVIAKMGSTGRATGNHLHFEIRIGGTAVDPMSYLN